MFQFNNLTIKQFNHKKGFTVLEILIAMLVITIGGMAAYAMVQQIIFSTISSSYRLTAAYLAKEGIENIRNTRDTNWLQGASWDYGISPPFESTENNVLLNYNRNTTISSNLDGSIKVSVEIEWTERGDTHTITVQENLYDWY